MNSNSPGSGSTSSEPGVFTGPGAVSCCENTKNKFEQSLLRAIHEESPDGILVVDKENIVVSHNRRLLEVWRIDPAAIQAKDITMIGRSDLPLLSAVVERTKNPELFLKRVKELYSDPNAVDDCEIELRDGRTLERHSTALWGEHDEYLGRVWFFRDITERKRYEDKLRQLSVAVEQSPVAVVITDLAGNITYVNPTFTRCTGYSFQEALGQNPRILKSGYSSPEVYEGLWRTITGGYVWHGEFHNRKKSGELYWESATITPIVDDKGVISHFLAIKEDITESRLIEAELRQAQKLEAIGHLAAGIAHEINTPTQFVSDNLTFLADSWKPVQELLKLYQRVIHQTTQADLGPGVEAEIKQAEENADLDFLLSEIPRAIEQSLDGSHRVAKIVRAMKEFSHPDSVAKTHADINKAIETTITVARNEWKYVADIETAFDGSLPPVLCHPGDFNQVILNLIVNAAHAIKDKNPEGQKGRITVSTKAAGDCVEIAIADSGTGIPETIRSRVFDPFFTTKEVGKGTGQGLALAHNVIVRKHGGKIWFETESGGGTTFFIQLPISGEHTPVPSTA
jgi:PAS domain S-box-containing protein